MQMVGTYSDQEKILQLFLWFKGLFRVLIFTVEYIQETNEADLCDEAILSDFRF